MNVDTSPNYFSAHIRISHIDFDEMERQVQECVDPFYTLSNITLEDFKDEYKAEQVLLNKVTFPYAIINLIQGIYHLAVGLLMCSKMTQYTGVRDLEEGWGRVVRVFSDVRGAHIVERALFHKSAYTYFSSLTEEQRTPFSYNGVIIPHKGDATRQTLRDLKNNPDFIISKFKLEQIVEELGGKAFLEKLNNINEYYHLSNISIFDFIMFPAEISSLYLISDEELADMPFLKLKTLTENESIRLKNRLLSYRGSKESLLKDKTSLTTEALLKELPPYLYFLLTDKQVLDLDFSVLIGVQIANLVRRGKESKNIFAKIPVDKVNEIYKEIKCLDLVSDDQIKKLINLEAKDIDDLLLILSPDEKKRVFALLSSAQLQPILSKLNRNHLSYVTDDQLKELDLSNLDNFDDLFPRYSGDLDKTRNRFKALSNAQVMQLLPLFETYHFILLSDDQIKANISSMDESQVNELFPGYSLKEEHERIFALLTIEQKITLITKFKYDQIKLFTEQDLKQLKLENLTDDELSSLFKSDTDGKRFSVYTKEDIQSVLPRLSNESLKHIPTGYIKVLDISQLDSNKLVSLFDIYGEDKLVRFASIQDEQFESILPNIDYSLRTLVSDAQFLKYAEKLNDPLFRYAFTHFSEEGLRRLLLLSPPQVNSVYAKLNSSEIALLDSAQIAGIDFSNRSKGSLLQYIYALQGDKEKFALLEDKQAADLLSQLSAFEFKYISQKQFESLKFSELPGKIVAEISLYFDNFTNWISKTQLEEALKKEPLWLTEHILNKLKDRLKLSEAEVARYRGFLKDYSLAFITPEQINAKFDKLGEQVNQLNSWQISGIDFSNRSRDSIINFFNIICDDVFIILSGKQLTEALPHLTPASYKKITLNQFEDLDFSNLNVNAIKLLKANVVLFKDWISKDQCKAMLNKMNDLTMDEILFMNAKFPGLTK